jgi:predicted permease
MANLKLAFRTLFKTPFVTVVAALSLALGIGANSAIYSMFDEILMRPLPVHQPSALLNFVSEGPKGNASDSCGPAGDCNEIFTYPMFRDLEKANTAFSGIAGHRIFSANVAFRNQTINTEGVFVSGSYFPLLGVQPAHGRLLAPGDDQTIGGHPVAVISHDYWQGKLGADRTVLGQNIMVNGRSLSIVGVAPEGFSGTTLGTRPVVFVPITMRAVLFPNFRGFENRRSYWVYLFGRMKPGVAIGQASTSINAVFTPILHQVEAPLQVGMSDSTLAKFKAKQVGLKPGHQGQSNVQRNAKTPLLMLFTVTGIVLLIACANIANLLLARGASRSTEMAVRLSLGAQRRQLVVQLLTESVLLGIIGGTASVLFAYWTLGAIRSMMPPEAASTMQFAINGAALLFAGVTSIATGILFGLFPALQSTRPDLVTALRAGSGKTAGARVSARFRNGLVVTQIALSMALLSGAGLFIRSLMNVARVDLGLKVDNVVTFAVSPSLNAYERPRTRAFFARLEEEIATLPGVTGVTAAVVPLLSGSSSGNNVAVQGFVKGPDTDANSRINIIGPAFFRTLGIPLTAGREFTTSDAIGSTKVAIVNAAFAKKFGLGRDAVGKLMSRGSDTLDIQIVGLVPDTKYNEVKGTLPPLFYTPYKQDSLIGSLNFYVRAGGGDPTPLVRAIPQLVARLDPNLPVQRLKTMPQQIRENIFLDRMISTLSAAFAILATLLAAVGLYGVLAYSVAQRTKEIGVRMALGADRGRVQWLVLRQVAILTAIGSVVGLGGALSLGRGAKSLLFELEGQDPIVLVGAAALLAAVALAAGYLPALKASKVDPMQALRHE